MLEMFQSLIGRLQTRKLRHPKRSRKLFQSLIGRLQTFRRGVNGMFVKRFNPS